MTLSWLKDLGRADRGTLVLVIAWTAICTGPGHNQVVHLVHPLSVGIGVVWSAALVFEIIASQRARDALHRISSGAAVGGVSCRVLPGQAGAFTLGAVRPGIYVGIATLRRLGPDEARAVMLHEEHHRRSLAPLRSAAIHAWLRMFGWVPFADASGGKRLAQMEIQADQWALGRGVEASAIASAMLKCPPPAPPHRAASLFGGAGARARWLTGAGAGHPARFSAIPMEAAPLAFVLLPMIACWLLGTPG